MTTSPLPKPRTLLNRPLGVKLIAGYWMYLIGDITRGGFQFVAAAWSGTQPSPPVAEIYGDATYLTLLIAVAGILAHLVAIYGLLNLRLWGRRLAIVVSCIRGALIFLGALSSAILSSAGEALSNFGVVAMYTQFVETGVTVAIVLYLIRPATRNYFRLQPVAQLVS